MMRIRRYLSLEEARVAVSFLRSAGIEAELDSHEICSMAWRYIFACGVNLTVPSAQAEDALAGLRAVDSGAFSIPDVEPLSRGVGARIGTALLVLA